MSLDVARLRAQQAQKTIQPSASSPQAPPAQGTGVVLDPGYEAELLAHLNALADCVQEVQQTAVDMQARMQEMQLQSEAIRENQSIIEAAINGLQRENNELASILEMSALAPTPYTGSPSSAKPRAPKSALKPVVLHPLPSETAAPVAKPTSVALTAAPAPASSSQVKFSAAEAPIEGSRYIDDDGQEEEPEESESVESDLAKFCRELGEALQDVHRILSATADADLTDEREELAEGIRTLDSLLTYNSIDDNEYLDTLKASIPVLESPKTTPSQLKALFEKMIVTCGKLATLLELLVLV
eukprot:m.856445 g.856445  ORF g.856445 m.856445 type:complete len:300 (+) comp59633_c2_seq1:2-901(+)